MEFIRISPFFLFYYTSSSLFIIHHELRQNNSTFLLNLSHHHSVQPLPAFHLAFQIILIQPIDHLFLILQQTVFHIDGVRYAHHGKIGVNVKSFNQRPQFIQLFYLCFLCPVLILDFLVMRISVLTDFKVVVSFVASPPISTVMLCILDATPLTFLPNEKEPVMAP